MLHRHNVDVYIWVVTIAQLLVTPYFSTRSKINTINTHWIKLWWQLSHLHIMIIFLIIYLNWTQKEFIILNVMPMINEKRTISIRRISDDDWTLLMQSPSRQARTIMWVQLGQVWSVHNVHVNMLSNAIIVQLFLQVCNVERLYTLWSRVQ